VLNETDTGKSIVKNTKPVPAPRHSTRRRKAPDRYGDRVMSQHAIEFVNMASEPVWERKVKCLLTLLNANPNLAENTELLKSVTEILKERYIFFLIFHITGKCRDAIF
jgi:hypothetical protein